VETLEKLEVSKTSKQQCYDTAYYLRLLSCRQQKTPTHITPPQQNSFDVRWKEINSGVGAARVNHKTFFYLKSGGVYIKEMKP
jgi:predicted methyltransferase